MKELLIEAIVVGIITIAIGTIIGYIISKQLAVDLPPVCKSWNKNYMMELCLFLTGVFTHLVFEFMGTNQWYCERKVKKDYKYTLPNDYSTIKP